MLTKDLQDFWSKENWKNLCYRGQLTDTNFETLKIENVYILDEDPAVAFEEDPSCYFCIAVVTRHEDYPPIRVEYYQENGRARQGGEHVKDIVSPQESSWTLQKFLLYRGCEFRCKKTGRVHKNFEELLLYTKLPELNNVSISEIFIGLAKELQYSKNGNWVDCEKEQS